MARLPWLFLVLDISASVGPLYILKFSVWMTCQGPK